MSFAVPGAGQIYTENFLKPEFLQLLKLVQLFWLLVMIIREMIKQNFLKIMRMKIGVLKDMLTGLMNNANKLIELYNQEKNASRELLNSDEYSNLFFDEE